MPNLTSYQDDDGTQTEGSVGWTVANGKLIIGTGRKKSAFVMMMMMLRLADASDHRREEQQVERLNNIFASD